MIQFDNEPLTVENGIMFGRVTIDGTEVRAGITLAAFEQLVARAGLGSDEELTMSSVSDVLDSLRPTIEAYLQSKHFVGSGRDDLLIIDEDDLVTH